MEKGKQGLKLEVGLKKAVDWIVENRSIDQQASLSSLIDQASRKFDLSPLQAEFLYRHLTEAPRE
jgi:hypothetical protein